MLCAALLGQDVVLHRWSDVWTRLKIHSGERQSASVMPALEPMRPTLLMTTFLEIARLWFGTEIQLAKPNPAEMWAQRAVGNTLIQEQLLDAVLLLECKALGLAATRLEKL